MAPRAHVLDDSLFREHVPLGYHPERPERLLAAGAAKNAASVIWSPVAPRAVTAEEATRVHTPAFFEKLDKLRGRSMFLDPDTYLSGRSVEVAFAAAGGMIDLVNKVIDDSDVNVASDKAGAGTTGAARGVALVRPPGHHALADRAMGFCLLNNVAIAAAAARARGLTRIAIMDFDVHHGNGTQDIFYGDPSVLYLSTHQFPFYPGTGSLSERGVGAGKGFNINVPISASANDAVYSAAFERVILPALDEYKPELVLVSAGFDAAEEDPLAEIELSADAFGWMTKALADVADRHAKGRLGLILEGGYDLGALERGLAASLRGMFGESFSLPRDPDAPDVDYAAKTHGDGRHLR